MNGYLHVRLEWKLRGSSSTGSGVGRDGGEGPPVGGGGGGAVELQEISVSGKGSEGRRSPARELGRGRKKKTAGNLGEGRRRLPEPGGGSSLWAAEPAEVGREAGQGGGARRRGRRQHRGRGGRRRYRESQHTTVVITFGVSLSYKRSLLFFPFSI